TACSQDLSIGSMRDASIASGNGGSDPTSGAGPSGGSGAGGAGGTGEPGGSGGSDASTGAIDARVGDADSSAGPDVRPVDARRDVTDASVADVLVDVVDAEVCRPPRAACTRGDECCSGFCIAQACFVPPTGCQIQGTACTLSGTCCSGRCGPVGANLVCRTSCSADGARCTNPQECCSLGCTNGICGGLCRPQAMACSANAD